MDIVETLSDEQREVRMHDITEIVKRRTWYEEALLISEFHTLAQERYGVPDPKDGNQTGWSMKDTANALGISIPTVLLEIRLVKCCAADPTIAANKRRQVAIQDMYLKFSWVGADRLERRVTK